MAERHGAREQFLREPPAQRLTRIAANFTEIASCIANPPSELALTAVLQETRTWCAWACSEGSTQSQRLFASLGTALETWQSVWPRLGAQQEFRLAVAREAHLWSKRLQALAKQA